MYKRDVNAFRERFNRWKSGELVYDKGRPITYSDGKEGISDSEYISIMERVASENNPKWNKIRRNDGDPELSEDEELRRILNDNSYDYRSYYNKYPNSRANADTHWTDEFKTVYNPTFSVYSKYSGKKSLYNPEGVLGGQWLPNETYIPAWGQLLPSQKLKLPGFQDGKDSIYIKPSKRGSFTAAAKRRGMTVGQLESAVLNNPGNYSEAMRKKAQFSRNARKWKH